MSTQTVQKLPIRVGAEPVQYLPILVQEFLNVWLFVTKRDQRGRCKIRCRQIKFA